MGCFSSTTLKQHYMKSQISRKNSPVHETQPHFHFLQSFVLLRLYRYLCIIFKVNIKSKLDLPYLYQNTLSSPSKKNNNLRCLSTDFPFQLTSEILLVTSAFQNPINSRWMKSNPVLNLFSLNILFNISKMGCEQRLVLTLTADMLLL